MLQAMSSADLDISRLGHVAVAEIRRPPNNFFDAELIADLADALHELDEDSRCRAVVLCSQGKHFCAGNNFAAKRSDAERRERAAGRNPLYSAAVRLVEAKKPVVAAIQGAAVGGGFGLAAVADFRVVCPEARFTANFVKLGFHPGFGLTHTLPRIIGSQRANLMFLTGRRINGETAHEWGLADVLTTHAKLRDEAIALAQEIAENAPLALLSVRATMRQGLADALQAATDHENAEQGRLSLTEDHKEGIRAVSERRLGNFVGR